MRFEDYGLEPRLRLLQACKRSGLWLLFEDITIPYNSTVQEQVHNIGSFRSIKVRLKGKLLSKPKHYTTLNLSTLNL